ncbi:MAG: phosphate signaling complex protein PhoU [Pseudomonadota bacterium]
MTQHIVYSYDKELNNLRNSVIEMAELVRELIVIAKRAVKEPGISYVELANITDRKINNYDDKIEELAIQVLALRQPMAVDLRHVVASLKLAVIIERMGDLTKKVSHRIEFLPITPTPKLMELIQLVLEELDRLLADVIKAYKNVDINLAAKVIKEDKLIDSFYHKIMDLLNSELEKKPQQASSLLNLVLIARNIERVGDYITKIARITDYIVTGKKLKA